MSGHIPRNDHTNAKYVSKTSFEAPKVALSTAGACHACASAKVRCSGDTLGCERCRRRGLKCTYKSPALKSPTLPTPPNIRVNDTPNIPPATSEDPFASELWDPNMLPTTNWLDALWDENDTFGFMADGDILLGPDASAGPRNAASVFDSPVQATLVGTTLASASSEETTTGEYYVDGLPGRLPQSRKRRRVSTTQGGSVTQMRGSGWQTAFSAEQRGNMPIPDETYERIIRAIETLVSQPATGSSHLVSSNSIPTKGGLERLLHTYWTSFNPTLPVSHVGTMDTVESPIVILARCSLGESLTPVSDETCIPLHNHVSRLLSHSDNALVTGEDDSALCQARLLNYIRCLYGTDGELRNTALQDHETLRHSYSHFATKLKILQSRSFNESSGREVWLAQETCLRLAYSAWLLDAMKASQYCVNPQLSLEDAWLPLPCSERLWDAKSSMEWQEISVREQSPPSLNTALQELYIEKRVRPGCGEFARILIIHGLYHQLWEVGRYFSNPLAAWVPVAQRQQRSDVLPEEPVWLPVVPEFAKWQNAACDALDVLHWQANATIAQACGLEHPTVLHLHFARIVLLAPLEQILKVARHQAGFQSGELSTYDLDKRLVQRWAVQHPHKARLAAIHAGVLFWHIRRHSIDAFYEAPALALSALVLWAFGTFAVGANSAHPTHINSSRIQLPAITHRSSSEDEGEKSCSIILLDRPTDDELVQHFIRAGHKMEAHISGIGDLYSAKGPSRVLSRASRLLASLDSWEIAKVWLEILDPLSRAPLLSAT
ncbi:hypothetical protein LTR17_023742 [Elasticomyces elasticus]|nr:hypothetical protein LTR17_023742 [Elasticomyces elasticus]